MVAVASPSPRALIGNISGIHSAGGSLSADPSGNLLLASGSGGRAAVWDFVRHEIKASWKICERPIWRSAFCDTRLELAIASADGLIRIWDPRAGGATATFNASTRRVVFLRYAENGNLLIWADAGGKIHAAECASWRLIGTTVSAPHDIRTATADSTANTIAMAGYQPEIHLFDRLGATPPARLAGHPGGVYSLAFHPNEPLLASGGRDCLARLWDVPARKQLQEFHGHTESVLALAFSPDGAHIASGDASGTIILWDRVSGHELARQCLPRPSTAESLVFARNGTVLAACGTGAEIGLWNLLAIAAG